VCDWGLACAVLFRPFTPSYTPRIVAHRLRGEAAHQQFESHADVRRWLPGAWQEEVVFTCLPNCPRAYTTSKWPSSTVPVSIRTPIRFLPCIWPSKAAGKTAGIPSRASR
jgi:hypothetical protein